MIRAFLFDIGNVLLKFDVTPSLARIAALSEIADHGAIRGEFDRLKSQLEDGRIDRATFLQSILAALRFRGQEHEFIAAWNEIFEPNEPMVALLEQLRGRFPLYLLSNTNDLHREYFLNRYPFFGHFAGGIYSDVVRLAKPSRAIYEVTAKQLGLEPAATFFIDDLLPNIEAAREFGFHAHHYHHERHDRLLAELKTMAII